MNVKDKVCVVTGGASGIGLALCTRFAREGAHVVLSDLRQEACEREAAPIGAFPVAADVGREEDVAHLVEATVEHFGRIDLFVSNAGIAIDGGLDTPNEGWRKIIGVSLLVPAAVLTPILAGKEDTPEGQDAITTDQLADIVMEGLAEERFLINTHPWVLEKFAVKARDYEEYIRGLRADQAAADAREAAAV
jgi:NAD(P)-dependent dehydrogenase (short-subunit alcohol dehydrogenase family)